MAEKKTVLVGQAKQRGEKIALLVIDMQNGLFRKSTPIYNEGTLLATICALIGRAHQVGAPVIYVQHSDKNALVEGTQAWALHPQLQPEAGDLVLRKRHPNSFQDTPLEAELEARQVGVLVVTGLVTHGCVRATCVGASALGYQVILAQDGHSNYHKEPVLLIEETQAKLQEQGIRLAAAREISFSLPVLS